MMQAKGLRLAVMAILALVLLALPLTAGAQKGKVRFAYYKPGWGVNGIIHAEDLLKKLGWDATYVAHAGSPAALITAFGAGQFDVTDMSLWLAANMYERKIPLKVIGTVQSNQVAIVVPKDSPLRSVEQLTGRKVAAIVASTAYHEIRQLMKVAYNFDVEKQAKLITATSPPDAVNLLERGDVDAMIMWSPVNEQVVVTGKYRYLVKAIDIWRKGVGRAADAFPVYVVFIANPKFLEANPGFAADLNKAQQQAADIFYGQKERAVRLIVDTIGIDRKAVEFTHEQTAKIMVGLTDEQVETIVSQLKMAKDAGYVKDDLWADPARIKREFFWGK